MAFTDKLKAKAAELGLDEKVAAAKEKAAGLADENRDKIAGAVSKAGQSVNEKTGGKYSDHISKAQDAALKGVDKVAATRDDNANTVGGEDAARRTVGADASRASDDITGESPVERAIGADATSISLDPHSPHN